MSDESIWQVQLFEGHCLDILPTLQDNSVNLIVTSPPYADQRKDTYGGIHPDKYVEWFMTRMVYQTIYANRGCCA